jgi:hypothetical protein
VRYLHGVFESVVVDEVRGVLRVHHLQQLGTGVGDFEGLLPLATLHVQLAKKLHVATLHARVTFKHAQQRRLQRHHLDHRVNSHIYLAELP